MASSPDPAVEHPSHCRCDSIMETILDKTEISLLVKRDSDQAVKTELPTSRPVPHVGRPMQRLEDAAILLGRGGYADDLGVKPGTLHASVVRSPHPHAEIKGIDVAAALKLKGVRAVLTRDDVK